MGKFRTVTYYTVIIPFEENNATEWHPTSKDFAPLTRGSFQTKEDADNWAREHLNGMRYEVKEISY